MVEPSKSDATPSSPLAGSLPPPMPIDRPYYYKAALLPFPAQTAETSTDAANASASALGQQLRFIYPRNAARERSHRSSPRQTLFFGRISPTTLQASPAMALSPSAQATSPLARQLLRHVSSGLVAAAFHRPAPAISLPSAPRGADDVALAASHHQRLWPAPSPKGRPGAPRQGSGGQVHHAAPAMATIASVVTPPTNALTAATTHVVTRGPARPGLPAQGGGGKTHGAPAAAKARAVMRGPAPPARPKEGSGGKVHVVSPAAMSSASVLMRGPAPPGHPAEGAGGRGGSIHAIAS
jgi:hypothetical protein